jgi:DNA-directed RNA polymerase subunit RPC12/RpoP
MGLHVLGRRCPVCSKKGLVIGADDGLSFRPQGWLVKTLSGRHVACPHCGSITAALLPRDLKELQSILRHERSTEVVTYHARPKKKRPPPDAVK